MYYTLINTKNILKQIIINTIGTKLLLGSLFFELNNCIVHM